MVLAGRAGGVCYLPAKPDLERAAQLALSGIDAQHQDDRKRCSAVANRIFCATNSPAASADRPDLAHRIDCAALVSAAKELPFPRLVLPGFVHRVCGAQGKELL